MHKLNWRLKTANRITKITGDEIFVPSPEGQATSILPTVQAQQALYQSIPLTVSSTAILMTAWVTLPQYAKTAT